MRQMNSPASARVDGKDRKLRRAVEDSALERVPAEQRVSGWSLAWMPLGIVTTLAVLLEGSLATAIAGVKAGLLAAVLMAIFASVLGWLVGNVARREGTSSTVTSRFHGLGIQGSGIASAVIAFGIISALGLENALLYNGTLFALNWDDTWATRIGIYGGMTLAWILLTLFGTVAVRRISSILVLAFLCLLAFMIWKAGFGSGVPITTTLSHGPLIPGLGSMNERFQAALVILAAPAVLLSVIGADYARWARSSKDVGIMAVCGSVMMEIVVVIIGAVIIFGSTGIVGDYLSQQGRATPEAAHEAASRLAENNTGAYFIILASTIGFLFMYAAQVKAQVLNSYTGALALTNLFDVLFRWRPGRAVSVVLSCVIGLGFVAGGVLPYLQSYLGAMGAFLSAFAAVMIADYYLLRVSGKEGAEIERVNWAGVFSVLAGSGLALGLSYSGVFSLSFLTALVFVLIVYPVLRLTLLPKGRLTRLVNAENALESSSRPLRASTVEEQRYQASKD